tara:strand:- start:1990 stop:4248 length:2259 start_codon:yes stop_codon:yes gene_type:complete
MKIDLEKMIKEADSNIEKVPLREFSEQAYLNYSMYVILDRALPNITDGLKPVQRRIIFAMNELGLKHNTKFKKSARTIGDVLGKFHPHGDTACYEAMVMLAQDFSYNYPFIEGQGNWGTQDDPKSFAAMRYTESRLTEFSNLFLDEIDMGTVKWVANFDGTLKEPKHLPSKIPNILVNGSSGIAVGMSTDIPSHNLKETVEAAILLLDKPKSTVQDIKKIIKAPDFPTKGEIVLNESDIDNIYDFGSGNIKIRATYTLTKKEIIIDSIPYQSTTTKIIEQIQEQIYSKKSTFLESVMDDSDQDNPVRLIIKYKGKSHNADDVISHLFFTTDLEKNIRVNMNMIGLNGKPQVKNIRIILTEWIDFRLTTIKNKLSWELEKIKSRIHILKAYIIVYKNLDKIIKIIRNEDEPKKKILKIYKFSEIQYEAIINIKIRNLAKLQEKNIVAELSELQKREQSISLILNSKMRLKTYLKKELKEHLSLFARERLTKINTQNISKALKIKAAVSIEPLTAILSKNGWIKFSKGHDFNLEKLNFKTGDEYLHHELAQTDSVLGFFDQLGYVYNLDSSNFNISRGQGEPISKYFQIQDGILVTGMLNLSNKLSVLNITNRGYGFMSLYEDLIVKNRKGKTLLKTKDDFAIKPVTVDLDTDTHYLVITSEGYMLIGDLQNIPIMAKGRGIKLINIPKNSTEKIVFVGILKKEQSLLFSYTSKKDKSMKYDELKHFFMEKNRRGKKIDKKFLLEKGKTDYNIE